MRTFLVRMVQALDDGEFAVLQRVMHEESRRRIPIPDKPPERPVDAWQEAIRATLVQPGALPDDVVERMAQALHRDSAIEAIRDFRHATNCGLVAAKDFVDRVRFTPYPTPRPSYEPPTVRFLGTLTPDEIEAVKRGELQSVQALQNRKA